MPIRKLLAAAVLALAAAPSLATGMPASASAQENATTSPERHRDFHHGTTVEANRASLATVRMRQRSMSRYERDRRAYRMAVAARHHRRAMARYDRRLVRQENAYAAAMAAWRRQVRACHHGDHRACRARAPRVASFY